MKILLLPLLVLILTGVVIFVLLIRSFRIEPVPHQSTPALLQLEFQEIRIPTQNNKQLYGWWIPGRNSEIPQPTIVIMHGWRRNLDRSLPVMAALQETGWNMVAVDSRNHGSSDPDGVSTMIKFGEDIQAAVDFALQQAQTDSNHIGVVGISIGGAGSLYAASQDSRISAVATIGTFAHPAEIMRYDFKRKRIPFYPFVWTIFRYFEFSQGKSLEDIAPINNLPSIQARLLLIHGDQDLRVPPDHSIRLAKKAGTAKANLWLIPGYGHSNCHEHPQFSERLTAFFRQVWFPE